MQLRRNAPFSGLPFIRRAVVPAVVCGALLAGCGSTDPGLADLQGRQGILDSARISLSAGKCDDAIETLEPLYESEYSDNDTRELYASAKACKAGMDNFLGQILLVVENAADLVGPGGLWRAAIVMYNDEDPEVAEDQFTTLFDASDALKAMIPDRDVVSLPNRLNFDSPNPASLLATDRIDNSNFFQIFVSLGLLGYLESRYGAPDFSDFSRGQILGQQGATDTLGWRDADNIDEAACGFAGEAVTLIDSILATADTLPDSVGDTLGSVASLYGSILDTACDYGCRGYNDLVPLPGLTLTDFSVTGCTFTDQRCQGDGTRPCLAQLRDRKFCATRDDTTDLDDAARCAAAGVATLVSGVNPLVSWSQ